jgi:hypothetical protein
MPPPTLDQFLSAFPPGLLVVGVLLYVLLYPHYVLGGVGALLAQGLIAVTAVVAGVAFIVLLIWAAVALGVCAVLTGVVILIAVVIASVRERR